MKVCKECGEEKSLSEFSPNKQNKDGLQTRCKPCKARLQREYVNSPERKERDRELRKQYRERNHEKELERYRRYDRENRDKRREKNKKWLEKNPGWAAEYLREYRKRKPEIMRPIDARHSARRYRLRKAAPGHHTKSEFLLICEYFGNRCLCCGATGVELTCDHIVPLENGGSDDISNCQPLCRKCNKQKGIQTIDYRGTQRPNNEDERTPGE